GLAAWKLHSPGAAQERRQKSVFWVQYADGLRSLLCVWHDAGERGVRGTRHRPGSGGWIGRAFAAADDAGAADGETKTCTRKTESHPSRQTTNCPTGCNSTWTGRERRAIRPR